MVPATQMLIDSVGWRWAYIVTGSVMLLILVPANEAVEKPDLQSGFSCFVLVHKQ
jgi:hypothetical protein